MSESVDPDTLPGKWARVRGRGWCYVVAWSGDGDKFVVSGLGGLKTSTVRYAEIVETAEHRPTEVDANFAFLGDAGDVRRSPHG